MSDINHKIKVFIPDYWADMFGSYLSEAIADAVKGLEATSAQLVEGANGQWLYLWNNNFPFTSEKKDAPEATILLNGQGYRVKWMMTTQSEILTR